MDRGARQATVDRVSKSKTSQSDLARMHKFIDCTTSRVSRNVTCDGVNIGSRLQQRYHSVGGC